MKAIKLIVKDNKIALHGRVDLVAGTVGQTCVFYFDDSWKNLNKKISYKVGPTIMGTYSIIGNETTIPAKVLMTAGLPLEIGIMGYSNDNSIVIPTSWCYIDVIRNGSITHPSKDNYHIIYDGGVIEDNSIQQHIIYDGGVID